MTDSFIATSLHSVLDPNWLLQTACREFKLPAGTNIQFYLRGINDTYKLYAPDNQIYALKVSRHNWRSLDQLAYESRLLSHLYLKAIPIAKPLTNEAGEHVVSINAPEGRRFLSLTYWLEGVNQRNCPSLSGSEKLGQHLAKFHIAGASFENALDQQIEYFSDLSVYGTELIKILSLVGVKHKFVPQLLQDVAAFQAHIPQHLPKGPCHGDVHGGNVIENASGKVSLIDFDVCGFGYCCFDVASYLWSIDLFDWGHDHKAAFLAAYENIRPITQDERENLPFFELLRDIWHLVTWARNADHLGTNWFHPASIERRMRMLQSRADQLGLG